MAEQKSETDAPLGIPRAMTTLSPVDTENIGSSLVDTEYIGSSLVDTEHIGSSTRTAHSHLVESLSSAVDERTRRRQLAAAAASKRLTAGNSSRESD